MAFFVCWVNMTILLASVPVWCYSAADLSLIWIAIGVGIPIVMIVGVVIGAVSVCLCMKRSVQRPRSLQFANSPRQVSVSRKFSGNAFKHCVHKNSWLFEMQPALTCFLSKLSNPGRAVADFFMLASEL